MFDFADKIVIVTGAAGNLGEATARAFRAAGAKLALVDNREDRLQKLYDDILQEDDCLAPCIDLTDGEQVNGMVAQVVGHYGRIDVLANIAGGFTMGPKLHETEEKTWDFMLNLNAKSVFLTGKAVLPHMLERGAGKIVSVAARAGLEGRAKMGPYVASKSAVIRLTETMAAEYKHQGINVNCIMPGTIDTLQNRAAMPNDDFDKWVPPEQIASIILFLASDAARAVQGAVVPVYGRS